ncbi:FAD-dependent oxidoreductase [Chondrinema litorale]|uniref:FAD-dependent oxidoreductase n=1 Tax=Chondrinema litorale TaxID=2994555 RepID=UPI002543254E|nr:FAD-dependent oxidoreductase [Chondrinema litorale]UZR93119.1 FAD-dependent oxidoreductase [Chondrinema litorale]
MSTRRKFMRSAGIISLAAAGGLASCSKQSLKYGDRNFNFNQQAFLFPKLKVSPDRIIRETVGLRPFRKTGFRVEKEMLDKKTIVHNYGHGGSGWSLSWGTGNLASDLAVATGEKKVAVMGCGTVGIATARLLQKKGCDVTIYAKDLHPNITSSVATGTWSPSSRVIEEENITPEFEEKWTKACNFSFNTFQQLLGLNQIVTWLDHYKMSNEVESGHGSHSSRLLIPGLLPESETISPENHPFHFAHANKQTTMVFNIPSYLAKQLNDFLSYGGEVVIKEFKTLEDVDALPEMCIVNCTGLGSKALFNDDNMMPISGQLSFLIPQPEFNYRISTPNGYAIPRKDGIILGGNAIRGNWDTTPDPDQTAKVVNALMEAMGQMKS